MNCIPEKQSNPGWYRNFFFESKDPQPRFRIYLLSEHVRLPSNIVTDQLVELFDMLLGPIKL